MKTATGVLIIGGGVAALWAIASSKSGAAHLTPSAQDIEASLLSSLSHIQAKQAAGTPLTADDIRAKQRAGVVLTQDEINTLMRAAK